MTGEYISAMREAAEVMETAFDNVEVYVEADLDFHLALAEATQNPIIPALMDTIIDLLREQRKRIGLVGGGLERGQIYHKKILEAIIHHDPQAARRAMQSHLQQVRDDSKASTD
jgi:GntR family transcriptional repressor for pyruvate dehydrogenase complex